MKELVLLLITTIFFIVAIAHLVRLMLKVEVKVGDLILPLWISVFGFIVPSLILVGIFKYFK